MLKQHVKAAKRNAARGNKIMIKASKRLSKLASIILGPYVITQLFYGDKIIVEDTNTGKEEIVHVVWCKKIYVAEILMGHKK